MDEYLKAVFPGKEECPGKESKVWRHAERYADACKEPFSFWVIVKTAERGTQMINQAGGRSVPYG